jgi:3-oxoacyl-[acyl-carrier protein] reductase
MMTPYVVGKGALAALSRCLAIEVAHMGIRVNCIAPGMTDTKFIGDLPERFRLMKARQNPTRRLGHPADIASAVAYLASEDADFVNGETLRVNGGSSMS